VPSSASDGWERSASWTCGERASDERDALLELRLLVRLGGLERALEVVEHGQELLHEPLVGSRNQARLVTRGPLAEVLELRLDALEGVDELVALLPERLELVDGLLRALLDFVSTNLVSHYEVLASSSSMTS
jgi:hypothetical protein